MTERGKRVARAVGSSKLAAWLIAILVGFLVLAFVIPQRGIFPDEQVNGFLSGAPSLLAWLVTWAGLDHVFTSTVFYAVCALLAVNLSVCTWRRAARRLRRSGPPSVGAVPDSALRLHVTDEDIIHRALEAVGAEANGAQRWYLRRGDLGFVGSVTMHVAMIAILLGGVLSGLTTFRGEMVFTEGQTRTDAPEEYSSISRMPVLRSAFKDFRLTLERMDFTYRGDSVVDAVANIRVESGAASRLVRARVNYPLKVRGKSFLLQDAGHAVRVIVKDVEGNTVADSFVNLLGMSDLGYRDSLVLPAGDIAMVSRPDSSQPLNAPMRHGLELVSPVVGLSAAASSTVDDFTWVSPGAPAVKAGGYSVTVQEVRIWNRFLVRADDGRYISYVAFILVIAGSIVRFIDPDRWLKVAVVKSDSGAEVYLWGAERYRAGVLPREGEHMARLVSDGAGRFADSNDAKPEDEDDS